MSNQTVYSIAQSPPPGSASSSAYIYSLSRTSRALASIASDDVLRFYDPSTLKITAERGAAHQGVTCLDTWGLSKEADAVLTAGRDGKVRGWDQRVGLNSSVFELGDGRFIPPLSVFLYCILQSPSILENKFLNRALAFSRAIKCRFCEDDPPPFSRINTTTPPRTSMS
jgi:WD40 repeat protein